MENAMREGAEWARELKAGDIFNGTMGEARARGFADFDAKAFHCAAYANLPGRIVMHPDSNVIARIEGER